MAAVQFKFFGISTIKNPEPEDQSDPKSTSRNNK